MSLRKSFVLVAPLAACLVATAHAAPPKAAPKALVFTDQTGDANAINDAGLITGSPVPEGTKTDPASAGQFDIKSLTIAATGKMATRKVGRKSVKYFNCTGYTATIDLSAAPLTTATLYRIQASTQSLDVFWLQFNNPAGGTQTTKLRYTVPDPVTGGTTTASVDTAVPAKIDGTKVIFTITAGDLKKAAESLGKTIISGLGVDVRTHGNAVTAPMWDQLKADEAAAWKVCPV